MTSAPLPQNIDALVIGAGPAGAGAAIALRRKGYSVLILEKENEIGKHRRGETIRYHEGMESLLYPGFFERQAIHKVNKRRYYSHTGKKFADRTISTWNLIISWPNFIKELMKVAQDQGADVVTNCEVVSLIQTNGKATGVVCEHAGLVQEIHAKLIVMATGHKGQLIPGENEARERLDIPVYKKLVKNYSGQDQMLEYFFQVDESWPAIAAIFPRGKGEAEVLIMFMTDSASKRVQDPAYINAKEIIANFEKLHPVFQEHLAGSETYYETFTMIPMGNIGDNVVPMKGIIQTGDAVGQVEARGGSGIRSSFMMGYVSAETAAETVLRDDFSDQSIGDLKRKVRDSEQMHELRDLNLKFGIPRRAFFSTVTDAGAMDMFWFALEFFMR